MQLAATQRVLVPLPGRGSGGFGEEGYIPAPSGYGGSGFQDANIVPVASKEVLAWREQRANEANTYALQTSWRTDLSAIRSESIDVFERYVGKRRKLPLQELIFLSINIAAEVGMDATRYADWAETVADKFNLIDFTGEGALDREGVAIVMEKVIQHYSRGSNPTAEGLDRPSAERLRQMMPFKEIFHEYDVGSKLGPSGIGRVFACRHLESGKDFAVKFLDKRFLVEKQNGREVSEDLRRELASLRRLQPQGVQPLFDLFEDEEYIYVVGEHYPYSLMVLLRSARRVPIGENWMRRLMVQVYNAVAYMHQQNVLHCDLKESNILIARPDPQDPKAVIADYGISRHFVRPLAGVCGTPGYMPPEVWTRSLWTGKGDVHCLAVVTFQFYTGQAAFPGRSYKMIRSATLEGMPDLGLLDSDGGRGPELRSLVGRMLLKDYAGRPSMRKCCQHQFFRQGTSGRDSALPDAVVREMSRLADEVMLRKSSMATVGKELSCAEIDQLARALALRDYSGEGVVTSVEFRATLAAQGCEPEQVQSITALMTTFDHLVPYGLFLEPLLMSRTVDDHCDLRREFLRVDADHSGKLDVSEIRAMLYSPVLKHVLATRDANEVIRLMDTNHDGEVSWREFRAALSGPVNRLAEQFAVAVGQQSPRALVPRTVAVTASSGLPVYSDASRSPRLVATRLAAAPVRPAAGPQGLRPTLVPVRADSPFAARQPTDLHGSSSVFGYREPTLVGGAPWASPPLPLRAMGRTAVASHAPAYGQCAYAR